MAALVQTYPQQTSTSTITILQTRPTTTSMLPSQNQHNPQYMAGSQSQRNPSHGYSTSMASSNMYRGSVGPVQPYAFTSTPSLNTNIQWQQYHTGGFRANSSPAVPTTGSLAQVNDPNRPRHAGNPSLPNIPYNPSMGGGKSGSRDDSSIPVARNITASPRPQSAYLTGSTPQMTFAQAAAIKPAPDRYRRPALQTQPRPVSTGPSGSGMATVGHIYNPHGAQDPKTVRGRNSSLQSRPNSFYGSVPFSAADDMQLNRPSSNEDNRRLRRRSMHTLDSADYPRPLTPQESSRPEESSRLERVPTPKANDKDPRSLRLAQSSAPIDNSMHARSGSSESLVSTRSSNSRPSSSANRNVALPTGNPSPIASIADDLAAKQDYPKLVNIPPRASSTDAAKRTLSPSPLSKPVTMEGELRPQNSPSSLGDASPQPVPQPPTSSHGGNSSSPAAQQLAAINQKGLKGKSKTSRLRRAFSFGSAADFRKAAAGQEAAADGSERAETSKLHKDPNGNDLYDAEQAAIAKKQEEGGIGNSIYGGRLFSGSTDNLSISSTASSASIMIRKMGRGMKKSTRSLVGLFRPKSVIGVPAADAVTPEASQAAVSMITVEAERVNVNPDPHAQHGGGTGFPRLERNSIDLSNAPSMVSERAGSSGTDNSAPRKSIVGGDRERAEVLAAVRKGILKHNTGSSSPSREKNAGFGLPAVPHVSDSPNSSAPSTPNDEVQGHKRTGSVAIGNEDYFMTALRLRQDTKSAPGTPQGTVKRNATFSPRLVFHDTWPSQEYDRRGEIATCNRLTPMLAQQIKEELNTFKMEMEVHENSKIYTHFF